MAIKKFVVGSFETNTYLITKGNKAVVVDPGLDIESILPELTNYEIEAVLITHAHIDHIDGVEFFNAPIYVLEPDLIGFKDMTFSLYQLCYQKPSFNYQNLKLIGVKDNEIITLPNFTFKVLATPGHTRGSCCYLYYNSLFSGDTLFKGSCGRTDFPGGNYLLMQKSLKRLVIELNDDVVVYPGHDEKTTIKRERQDNLYINRQF